jgi:hypothetical protein
MPQHTSGEAGSAISISTWADSLPGSQVSSSSQNATSSASEASSPLLRPPARPGRRVLLITMTGRCGSLVARNTSGSDWSKTTMTRTRAG